MPTASETPPDHPLQAYCEREGVSLAQVQRDLSAAGAEIPYQTLVHMRGGYCGCSWERAGELERVLGISRTSILEWHATHNRPQRGGRPSGREPATDAPT